MPQSARHDIERHLDGIVLRIGQSLGEHTYLSDLIGIDAPVYAVLAVLRDVDALRWPIEQLRARDFDGDLRLLGGLQVVVNDAGERDRIALRKEARHLDAHDQVFACEDAAHA